MVFYFVRRRSIIAVEHFWGCPIIVLDTLEFKRMRAVPPAHVRFRRMPFKRRRRCFALALCLSAAVVNRALAACIYVAQTCGGKGDQSGIL